MSPAFCPRCGDPAADGRCANPACPGAARPSAPLTRLPRPALGRRLAGSGLELVAFAFLELVGLLLSPVTLATAGMLSGLCAALYVALKDLGGGRYSLGKRVARVRIVDVTTLRPASAVQAWVRNGWFIVGWVLAILPDPVGLIGLLWVGSGALTELLVLTADPRGRRWGDRLAGTQVVPEEDG